jgi:MSHA biogenesis protein MshQ
MMRFLRLLLLMAAVLSTNAAHADTPITLFKSFAGNVNFTGTQKSLRTRSNSDNACSTSSTATMVLSGIPTGSTILAAYLYWAASGSTGDYSIVFDDKTVDAPASRRYSSSTVGYNFYSGAADVTDIVKARNGNATYVASGLTPAQTGYCNVQAVLGGFQLLVVYSNSKETFRVLNVYEGFQYIQNSSVELTLANFTIPNPVTGLTARVGHITWEGDDTLGNDGETLLFNGVDLYDTMNPRGNQFNSASNINNDYYSYGVDFDAFTVSPPAIAAGQKSAKTTYLSKSDLVLLNAEIIAAPNIPATDRSVTLTLDGPLVPSSATTYTVSVVNNGPMDEGGPLTVTGTLPASLIYGGSAGTNWSCTAAGQLITCTYSGTVAKNTTLPPLTLTVTPAASASGLVLFSVTVGGKLFDYYDGNNTSTVSARIGSQDFLPVFLFTDRQCVHNKPFGDPAQPCKPLQLPHWPANRDIQTWITYVVKNVPTALATSNSTIPMRFALSCHDPRANAGVAATYDLRSGAAKLTLPLCRS